MGFFSSLFDPVLKAKTWLDVPNWFQVVPQFIGGLKRLIGAKPHEPGESSSDFATVCREKGLNEEGIQKVYHQCRRLFWVNSVLSCAALLYAFYFFHKGQYLGLPLSICVVCITLGLTFRYHFWAYQIQKRQLGLGLREWWSDLWRGH